MPKICHKICQGCQEAKKSKWFRGNKTRYKQIIIKVTFMLSDENP